MRPTKLVTVVVCGLFGCVDAQRDDATPPTLIIEPAELTVTVVDGYPVVETYTATLVDAAGARDVTAETTFVLEDASYGAWSGSSLQVTGDALGLTRVVAAHGGLVVQVPLIVHARLHRIESLAPVNAPQLFQRAVVDASCAPAIAYPSAEVVMPSNLGELDLQVTDAHDDLFEIALSTRFLDLRVYTRRDDATTAWTTLAAADWDLLAAQGESVAVRVSGVLEAAPSTMCKSATQRMYITDQALAGGLFYANAGGMMRFDASHASFESASLFSAAMWEAMFSPITGSTSTDCHGCALSRDGKRLAIASPTQGAIYDFTTKQLAAVGSGATARAFDFATFTIEGDKLLATHDGTLSVIGATGALLATVTDKTNYKAYDPQMSPIGRSFVYAVVDEQSAGGTLIMRSFVDDANDIGLAHELMPIVPGTRTYYPAWSPDGAFIVFTRASGWGSLDAKASLWIVRTDGTQPPIQLTQPTTDLSVRARFTPSMATMSGEPMYYVTYESTQPFAGRTRMQLWAMPFYPERAPEVVVECTTVGSNCTPASLRALEPAFRLPQPLDADNRLLQWTN
jgi:hypothetical protein